MNAGIGKRIYLPNGHVACNTQRKASLVGEMWSPWGQFINYWGRALLRPVGQCSQSRVYEGALCQASGGVHRRCSMTEDMCSVAAKRTLQSRR